MASIARVRSRSPRRHEDYYQYANDMGYEPGAWSYSPSLATSQEDYDRGFALPLDTLALPPLGTKLAPYGADVQVSEKQNEGRSSSEEGILTCAGPAHGCPLVLDLNATQIHGTERAYQSREGDHPTSPTSSLGRSDGPSDDDAFAPEDFPDDIDQVIRVPDLSSRFGKLQF
jgi:hypothetical protein